MVGSEVEGRVPEPSHHRGIAPRIAAATGAIFCAWVALDTLVTNIVGSDAPGNYEFLLFWNVPFAAMAAILTWYTALGSRAPVREATRRGCLGALLAGGLVFLALCASPLVLKWDALRGVAEALVYAPLAATIGLIIGLGSYHLRKRGS
jgi:hypothetical protein